jgi:hypothetical protein
MEGDLRIDQIEAQSFETRELPFLVRFHQPLRDGGGNDRRKPSRITSPPNLPVVGASSGSAARQTTPSILSGAGAS